MPAKYRVTTDQGTYEVTVDEPSSSESQSGSNAGLGLAATGAVLPAASTGLAAFGTSPTAAKVGGTIGRVVGALAPMAKGIVSADPLASSLTGALQAPVTSWAGGKIGYFGTKMLQDVARPASVLLDKAAPYVSRLGGVQGGLDLAQMAEPNRKDIGFLGMGPSVNVPGAEPPVLNRLAAYILGRSPANLKKSFIYPLTQETFNDSLDR